MAFIRFLTKMTGGNVSGGVGGQIKALTDSIATLKGAATAATAAAETRNAAFDEIRRLAFQLFMSNLLTDCVRHMAKSHGKNWSTKPRKVTKGGTINELGRDRDTIANMLWHSTHTNWFEYNAGSRLIHFRFPKQYRKEVRDGRTHNPTEPADH